MTRPPAPSISFFTLIGAILLVPPFIYWTSSVLRRLGGFEPLAVAFGSLPPAVQASIAFICPALAAGAGILALRARPLAPPSTLNRLIVVVGVLLGMLAALAAVRAP